MNKQRKELNITPGSKAFTVIEHEAELCVVGGGLAGICAAVAAARRGVKVVLMHDRPVLGGNASSEIRMWVVGTPGRDMMETGIIEEIMLENRYRNPESNYSIWDSILYEKVKFEKNIELLLNCSCNDLEMDGEIIKRVFGWQMTTQTRHNVRANLFVDSSGDSILAPMSGAEFVLGREARSQYGEDLAPEFSDDRTMGMSCLIQAREMPHPTKFIAPEWAYKYPDDDSFPFRDHTINDAQNFWWLEIGGEGYDIIKDTENIRDELLKIGFGVWDHIKNNGDHGAENWSLDWIGFLPGKRESRRYVGEYVLTQNDIRDGGNFEDIVAYGGWPMDDHHPAGFYFSEMPTEFHDVTLPYGIPYRCLYSNKIKNLYFCGRNISVTHVAMSSTRVMATCALLGQAVGRGAALATKYECLPGDIYHDGHISELQQGLLDDDCYLLRKRREVSGLTKKASLVSSCGDSEQLRNGIDRPCDGFDNSWEGGVGDWVEYRFEKPEKINGVRLIFDSDLNRLQFESSDSDSLGVCDKVTDCFSCEGGVSEQAVGLLSKVNKKDPAAKAGREMRCCYPLYASLRTVPETMVKSFQIEIVDACGDVQVVHKETNNYQRHVELSLDVAAKSIRFVPTATWGAVRYRLFAFDLK